MIKVVDIAAWMNRFLLELDASFANRIYFVGLQGSYGRGEATETSDIDIVVILDELSVSDIEIYNTMLDGLPNRELICGFLSGKKELLKWESSELFQFYYDTTPIRGCLDELLTEIDEVAINRAIKIGVCNIYHGCVHNILHEKSEDILKKLYKSASFIVQAIVFKQTRKYVKNQSELLSIAFPNEKAIVDTVLNFKKGDVVDFSTASEMLLNWSKKWIVESD